ncbi:MAG: alpha amylase C-terminal domain-containing protein, partial [Desulfatitalea sp.]|nr:alpha amylase C-terminal domain-containing protein [Desulfatitalea sp.]
DCQSKGFAWIDCNDSHQSVLSLIRTGKSPAEQVIVVCNFSGIPIYNYQVGAPRAGIWDEVLNSDARQYGGSSQGNQGSVEAAPVPTHGMSHSLTLVLPPLGVVFFKSGAGAEEE